MDKYDKEIRFTEQHAYGGTAVVTMTERQAIDAVKAMPVHKHVTDEDALNRFIILYEAAYFVQEI